MAGWLQQAERYKREARGLIDRAAAEGRAMTTEERARASELLDAAEASASAAGQVATLEGKGYARGLGSYMGDSPGGLFTKSEGWRKVSDPLNRPQRWSTGPVEIASSTASLRAKAGTLLEGAQGVGFVATPQVIPGVVEKLFQPLSVVDLLPSPQATTSSVRYMIEGTATSGAAGVLEGGVKPASDLTVSTIDEPVKKIATTLTVSDELLDDGPSVRSYIDSHLSLFVRQEEDRQLLRGTAGNELNGLFNRGINVYNRGTVDNNAVGLLKAMSGTRGSSFSEPDAIVMHPDNWLTTRLLTDTTGQFFGGGPFSYAGAGQAGAFGDTLWNKPVVLTTNVGPGTALLGSFSQAAAAYRRGGVSLEISNSHQDYFVRNPAMARAEERLALCCYRPGAYTEVRGLS
jgi:HK97 family phage major capsid protein